MIAGSRGGAKFGPIRSNCEISRPKADDIRSERQTHQRSADQFITLTLLSAPVRPLASSEGGERGDLLALGFLIDRPVR